MAIRKPASTLVFNAIGFAYVTAITAFCLVPFWLMISGSISDNQSVVRYGYGIVPRDVSLRAYEIIFEVPQRVLRSYAVTIGTTAVAVAAGLFLTSMGGYVLNRKDYAYRNRISFFVYFTTLFSGGLIPWYILMTKYLHLKNSYLALIVPLVLSPFLLILMRNFMKFIPDEIVESARIDGAGDFRIFVRLIVPLAKPALATIGLFIALASWNDWYLSSLFIADPGRYKLQFLLYNMMANIAFLTSDLSAQAKINTAQIPTETVKLATAVIVTGPVILFYPFAQKYFVRGITIGAVKG